MAVTQVQAQSAAVSTTSATLTITAPGAGNLLTLQIFSGAGNQTALAAPTGWSTAVRTTSTAVGVAAIFYRIANGTEGTSLVVSGSASSTTNTVYFQEWSSNSGAWAADPLDAPTAAFAELASTTTATLTAAAATSTTESLVLRI